MEKEGDAVAGLIAKGKEIVAATRGHKGVVVSVKGLLLLVSYLRCRRC